MTATKKNKNTFALEGVLFIRFADAIRPIGDVCGVRRIPYKYDKFLDCTFPERVVLEFTRESDLVEYFAQETGLAKKRQKEIEDLLQEHGLQIVG